MVEDRPAAQGVETPRCLRHRGWLSETRQAMSVNASPNKESDAPKCITEHLAADVDSYVYYRCTICGTESVDRGYVEDCCECECEN